MHESLQKRVDASKSPLTAKSLRERLWRKSIVHYHSRKKKVPRCEKGMQDDPDIRQRRSFSKARAGSSKRTLVVAAPKAIGGIRAFILFVCPLLNFFQSSLPLRPDPFCYIKPHHSFTFNITPRSLYLRWHHGVKHTTVRGGPSVCAGSAVRNGQPIRNSGRSR